MPLIETNSLPFVNRWFYGKDSPLLFRASCTIIGFSHLPSFCLHYKLLTDCFANQFLLQLCVLSVLRNKIIFYQKTCPASTVAEQFVCLPVGILWAKISQTRLGRALLLMTVWYHPFAPNPNEEFLISLVVFGFVKYQNFMGHLPICFFCIWEVDEVVNIRVWRNFKSSCMQLIVFLSLFNNVFWGKWTYTNCFNTGCCLSHFVLLIFCCNWNHEHTFGKIVSIFR